MKYEKLRESLELCNEGVICLTSTLCVQENRSVFEKNQSGVGEGVGTGGTGAESPALDRKL